MPFDNDLPGRTAETLTEGFTGTIGTTVTLAGNASLAYADNTLITAYGLAAGESEEGVNIVFSEEVAGADLWQAATVTLDYDTNSLTIDGIVGSSDGGEPVTFATAAATANIPLQDAPPAPEPIVFPNNNMPRHSDILYTLDSYMGRVIAVPTEATRITVEFVDAITSGANPPKFNLFCNESGYKIASYRGVTTYSGTTFSITNSALSTGIEIFAQQGWDSIRKYSGILTLTRQSPQANEWSWQLDCMHNTYRRTTGVGHFTMDGDIVYVKLWPADSATFSGGTLAINAE